MHSSGLVILLGVLQGGARLNTFLAATSEGMACQAREQLPVSPSAAAHTGRDSLTFDQLDGSNYDSGAWSARNPFACSNVLLPDMPVMFGLCTLV